MESGNHFSQDESEIHTSCGPANNATLSNLELALIKRKGKVATVPQGMTLHGEARGSARDAADAAERARGAGRWPALEPGSGPGGKGGDLPARQPQAGEASNAPGEPLARPRRRRDRIRPTLRLIQAVRWGTRNPSESQMNLR